MFREEGELHYIGTFDDIEEAHAELQKKRAEVLKENAIKAEKRAEREAQKGSYWKTEKLRGNMMQLIVVHNYPSGSGYDLEKILRDYEIRHSSTLSHNGFIRYIQEQGHRYLCYKKQQFDEIQKGNSVLLSRYNDDMIVVKPSLMNQDTDFKEFNS